MKILLIKSGIHIKNLNFLLNCKRIQINEHDINEIDNLILSEYDAVYSPCCPIDVSKYPNTKFIFGPHFSIFPEQHHMDMIRKNNNVVYIQPSDWVVKLWTNNTPICNDIKIVPFAFGVETDKFKETIPFENREQVFVYFKRRNHHEINQLLYFLQSKNIEIKIFDYVSGYSGEEYMNYLQHSKYGIWLDAHESQGFALQEALSCNVPLLVWNVSSFNQEEGANYPDVPATTIPYWDSRCGEYFYDINELEEKFNYFLSNIENYKPREYILENLSLDVCENKLIEIVEKM